MPIQSGDIKLLKSLVMADVAEGGGPPTNQEIADGVSNAIFPDISELDRALGRVSLRKVFAAVQTPTTDTYFGANVIVADPPDDPRVSVSLFAASEFFDTRQQASSRIEAYLNKGPLWPGYLYENHIAGQRVIQLFQRVNAQIPNVGQTLVLVQDENTAAQKEQYVRVISVSVQKRTFTDTGLVDYEANVVTLGISDALRYDFLGSPASRYFMPQANGTRVRDTVVADAGMYVGIRPLTQAAALGEFSVKADSIFTQLVPSAQTEIPISYAVPYAASGLPVPGAQDVSFSSSLNWTSTTDFYLPSGCLPGSLTISVGGTTITDDAGKLKTSSGEIGTIDYANGILHLNSGSLSGTKNITYRPAATILRAPQSHEIRVTQESRSQSYVGIIAPLPQPGTFSIAYMAQGRWYVLSDLGNGQVKGLDDSYGVGTINKDTGAFSVTLGALPDVGSAIILTWNTPTQEIRLPAATLKVSQKIALSPPPDKAIQPGTLSITWMEGSVTKTATANTQGNLSGDATGQVHIGEQMVEFIPNALPASNTQLTIDYVAGPKHEDSFAHPARNGSGQLPLTASLGAITPGSLEVEWNTNTDLTVLGLYTRDQLLEMGIIPQTPTQPAPGNLVDPVHIARDDGNGNLTIAGQNIGTVNYTTGEIIFNPDRTIQIPTPIYSTTRLNVRNKDGALLWRLGYEGLQYTAVPTTYPNDTTGYVKLRYNSPGSTQNVQEQVSFTPELSLVPGAEVPIVPGSVVLLSSDGPWGDSGNGVLRKQTGAGWVTLGTIDYLTGKIQLTGWPAMTNAFTRASCVRTLGENITSEFTFRTAAAPLRPGSLTIQFARAGGGTTTVTANVAGVISGTGVTGEVDWEYGIVRLHFGEFVPAAGNESQPWYDPALVNPNGTIFKPQAIAASTLRYSAVAYSYLPLDANLLGIDPVRLPQDGKVPIFRPGSIAVVGHTGTIGPITVSNGQTVNCGRVRLSRVRVIGNNGQVINTGYTTDLEAGTVTFTDVTGYSQPVTIEHRIEDMVLVRDVQITGEIAFTRPLTHDYPAGSHISSALVAGDLFARVSTVFDQATWDGSWKDSQQGSAATGTYNLAQYPIQVTNLGAITERWVVRFTNTTAFEVIGEHVGLIATGSVGVDCAPVNPATGTPYFTIQAAGWGSGWSAGNILRFNTVGAMFPVWVVRTVQQGQETVTNDSFTLLIRGDVDTP